MSIVPFEPQNELETLLVKAASDAAHRPQFYRALVESDLIVIQEERPPLATEERVLHAGEKVSLRPVEWNGKTYLAVFSSPARLQAVIHEEVSYLSMNALELMKLTRGAEMLLNPGSEYGKELTADEIASLIDGSIWSPGERYVSETAAEVIVGQPANYPTELAEALSRYFKTQRGIERAYLAHFYNPKRDEKPHTLVAIDCSGDWDTLVAGAGMIAQEVPVPDPPVDFMRMTGRGGLEEYFQKECTPFYRRKRFGLF